MNNKLFPLTLLGLIAANPVMAVTYTFKTLDGPGADATYPSDINDNGQVVGTYYDPIDPAASTGRTWHGFLYDGSTFNVLTVPGSGRTSATAINNLGKVVGSYVNQADMTIPNDFKSHGFLYSTGTFATLDVPSSSPASYQLEATYLADINDNGQIAANRSVCSLSQFSSCSNVISGAFLYSGGSFTAIKYGAAASGINAKGDIAGSYKNPAGGLYDFFLFDSNQTFKTIAVPAQPPISKPVPSWGSYPSSINDLGQIVGVAEDPNGTHGFLYDGNQATILNLSGANGTYASGINNNGQIVGTYYDNLGTSHGYIKDSGSYTTLDIPGAIYTAILKNNNKGQLIGYYQDSNLTHHGFLATPVTAAPKPSKEKDCKKGGWKKFGFKNKHQCETYVEKLKAEDDD